MRPQYSDQMKLKVISMESIRKCNSNCERHESSRCLHHTTWNGKFPNPSNSMQPRLKLSHLRSLNIFLSKVRNTISSPQEACRRGCLVRSHSAREGPRLEGSFWNLKCLNLDSFWCQMWKILTSCCWTVTYFPREWRPERMMPSGRGVGMNWTSKEKSNRSGGVRPKVQQRIISQPLSNTVLPGGFEYKNRIFHFTLKSRFRQTWDFTFSQDIPILI